MLLGRTRKKVARVSGAPGKTRLLNFYRVNDRFFLVDLPGFGYAKVPAPVRDGWRKLIEGYLAREDGPIAVVHLVDARRKPTDSDLRMLEYLAAVGLPTLVVLTKVDKLTRSQRAGELPELVRGLGVDPEQVIEHSSVTGEGRDALLAAVGELLARSETSEGNAS